MNIKPISGPQMTASTGAQTNSQQDARQRAIARLSSTLSPQNQNSVSTEDTIVSKSNEPEVLAGQSDSNETENTVQTTEASAPDQVEEGIAATETSEESKTKAKDPALSSQYAALARREKALRVQAQRQEQTLQAREAALAQREAELTSKSIAPDLSKYISKDDLRSNTLAALAEAEVSYDTLTQQYLEQGNVDPRVERMMKAQEAKIAKLEAQVDEGRKAQETKQAEDYKAAVKQIETDVKSMVFTDPAYEMIKVTGSHKDVVELIEANWKEKGILLTNEEAAQQVEDYLVEEAERLAKTNKMKKRLTPAASTQTATTQVKTPSEAPKQTQQTKPMKTLTNANSSPRQMSAKERAIAAFKGELK